MGSNPTADTINKSMINFSQFLEEERQQHLYHGTSLPKLYDILSSKQMRGQRGGFETRVQERAIFFSRSMVEARKFIQFFRWEKHPIVIEFDRQKLANNYKIRPIRNLIKEPQDRGTLAEEYVLGDIKNVDKYIKRILVVYDETWDNIFSMKKYAKLRADSRISRVE